MLAGVPSEAWMIRTTTMTEAKGRRDHLEMAVDMKVAVVAVADMKVGMMTEGTRPPRGHPREAEITITTGILDHPEVASMTTAVNGTIPQDLGEDLLHHRVVHQALPAPATNHLTHR